MTIDDVLKLAEEHFADYRGYREVVMLVGASELLAFAQAIERETLERAAKACDEKTADWNPGCSHWICIEGCARAIRALIAPPIPGPSCAVDSAAVTDKVRRFRVQHKYSSFSRVFDAIHEEQAWYKFTKEYEQHEQPARHDFTVSACHETTGERA